MPDERLPTGQMVILGLQHVVAMFGATVLAPILMGFDPNVSILFSGLATLIFFLVVGGRVPSYLGSSFAFIGPVLVATGASVGSPNPNIPLALGGIIAAGALYFLIGLVVQMAGHRWIERLMPPVVTGAIVAAIGLVLAPIAINSASGVTPDNAGGHRFRPLDRACHGGGGRPRRGLRAGHVAPPAGADRRCRRLPDLLSSAPTSWASASPSISRRSARPPGSACRPSRAPSSTCGRSASSLPSRSSWWPRTSGTSRRSAP